MLWRLFCLQNKEVYMNTLTLNDLLLKVSEYNNDEKDLIKKAYAFAEEIHRGQKRQSGEDYIQHPLNVAYILADMHADTDTICAGLLHDTIEDAREDPNVVKQHIIEVAPGSHYKNKTKQKRIKTKE